MHRGVPACQTQRGLRGGVRVRGLQVPAQLQEAFLGAIAAGRIRSMQNKLMPAAPLHRPGALLLGDAFNMRHPLTGALCGTGRAWASLSGALLNGALKWYLFCGVGAQVPFLH